MVEKKTDNMKYAEEFVREFLFFRGFTTTLQSFEKEFATDIGKGFHEEKKFHLIFFRKGEIGGKESEKWHSYPLVGRTGSAIPTASEVSVYEFRSAATGSDHYPGSLHAPFMSSPDSPPYIPERFIDDNLRKESFHGSRQDINAAIDRICEFSGSRIIFWDLREPFIQNLTTKVCCEYVLALMIQFCDLFCRTQACRTGDQTRCSTQEGCINNKVGITETAIDDAILGAIVRIFDKHVVVGEPLQSKSSQHAPMNTPKSMVTEISGNPNSDRRLH
ncbi:hypothetical protein L2E82_46970 [Cichorium intybus]|uniref:Uncharacterized protein n=1 Tax=Cichorium intybus TaxID=13427 RepID=A0ACB8YUT2_CICIN|nr:hypothetical protein L2E82_46970 [Cichorium intybus]